MTRPGAFPVLLGVLITSVTSTLGQETQCPDTTIAPVVAHPHGLVVREERKGLRRGDVLAQINGHEPHDCADLGQAVREAREKGLALLVLVRTANGAERVVSWSADSPAVTVARPTAVASTATPQPLSTPTLPSIASADATALRAMLDEIDEVSRRLAEGRPARLSAPMIERIESLRDSYERRRREAPSVAATEPMVEMLETAAEILAYRLAVTPIPRRQRAPGSLLAYGSDSPIPAWLSRYPFLQESVVEEPDAFHFILPGEREGLWQPARALQLLGDHAGDAAERLRRQVSTSPISPE